MVLSGGFETSLWTSCAPLRLTQIKSAQDARRAV
jgi:hypothetical protein